MRPQSEIYHAYAAQLKPPHIHHDTRSVNLRFELNSEIVQKRYQKDDRDKYLFEEIRDRTFKMHLEHIYCKRFMLPDIMLQHINVVISICSNDYSKVLGKIKYSLAEQGYPAFPRNIEDACPDVAELTGAQLAGRVRSLSESLASSPYATPENLLLTRIDI